MNPTSDAHDGGRTRPEINSGLAPGAIARSIREDPPRQKGAVPRHY
jgi:hypothetical protein